MAKQAVRLRIPIDENWDAGDTVQVYTNFGSGDIDTDKPLLARPVQIFPGRQPARGFGKQPLNLGRFGDLKATRPHRGLERTKLGFTPWATAPPIIEVVVDLPAAYGKWKFAAKVVDRNGNPQTGELQVIERMVSGTEPPPLSAFWFKEINGSGQAVFGFTKGQE